MGRGWTPGTPGARTGRGRATAGASVLAVLSLLAAGVFAAPAGAATPRSPFGYLDSATFVNGAATVSGWAIDPDTTHAIAVAVTVDGVAVARATASAPRYDVGRSFPAYGSAHGYSLRAPVGNGRHTVCVTAINVGPGANAQLGCRAVVGADNPVGSISAATRVPGGISVTGWALDPNTLGPITVRIALDGRPVASLPAAATSGAVPAAYSYYGPAHGVTALIPAPATPGSHTVCLTGVNSGLGTDTALGCATVAVTVNPVGTLTGMSRTAAGTLTVSGWALDPDTAGPVSVRVTANGAVAAILSANQPLNTAPASWSAWGTGHAFSAQVPVPATELTACVYVINVSAGADTSLGCSYVPTLHATAPPAPRSLTITPTTTTAVLHWAAPSSDGGAAILRYQVSAPGLTTQVLPATATAATFGKLTPAHSYIFTVRADNMLGDGTAATGATTTPPLIANQVTPAPVSTSHYPRNWTANAIATAALTRRLGAADAPYNPSGHRYLVLMDLGGQTNGGVMLSATSVYVPYAVVTRALESYLDGYVSTQKVNAPMTLAIGTNNDINVDAADGAIWARTVVDPVRAYAARYPSITVVGADDMEPGFSATVGETRSWLSGYLGATTAPFVFNGSADGCSTSVAGGRCNNGWTQADLQWLSGGAAPGRISVLPQIYNSAMPWQWRNISLAGLNARLPRLNFGGPLTEWSACAQAGCASISNIPAWSQLWSALNSTAGTRQPQMPFGTDLQIN